MKKKFWKVSNMLMSSVITIMGFSGCRSASHRVDPVECVYGPPPEVEEEIRRAEAERDSILQMQQQEQQRREEAMKVVYGPPPSAYRNAKPDADGIYDVVEDMPRFNGGVSPEEWVQQNLRYPAKARQLRVEGRVIVSFVVRDNGQIDGVTVVKSASPLLDQEAVRVVKSMKDWQPGLQRGSAVNVRYMLPVDFRLD